MRLAEGRYQLAAIDNGSIVEGSERDVLVVAGEVLSAVVLDIVPEERWTRVLMSNSAADAIHAAPGRTFYVALRGADRFDHQQHEQLVNPQAFGVAGRQVWVRRAPAADKRLEVSIDGQSWQPLALADYRVRQTRGADLGYTIEPAGPGETPEISAYRGGDPGRCGRPPTPAQDCRRGNWRRGCRQQSADSCCGAKFARSDSMRSQSSRC